MSNIIQILIVIFSLVGTIFTGVMVYFMSKINKKQEDAAVKVEQVKSVLETTQLSGTKKMDILVKVANDTHTLVNSNMGVQLKISAVALRRVANLTKEPDDIAAADLAEKALSSHEAKQTIVDSRNKSGA